MLEFHINLSIGFLDELVGLLYLNTQLTEGQYCLASSTVWKTSNHVVPFTPTDPLCHDYM